MRRSAKAYIHDGNRTPSKADNYNFNTAPILAPLFSNVIRKCSGGNGGRGGAEVII